MPQLKTIHIYGNIPRTPKEQLDDIKQNNKNTFLYMSALIKAEKINPNKEQDYDGEYRAEWLKKIAISDTDVESRVKLIKLFEND